MNGLIRELSKMALANLMVMTVLGGIAWSQQLDTREGFSVSSLSGWPDDLDSKTITLCIGD